VELLGRAFAELEDRVLLPWMPALLQDLRPRMEDVLPALLAEATRSIPANLARVDAWAPPWEAPVSMPASTSATAAPSATSAASEAASLLRDWPDSTEAWAAVLGLPPTWEEAPAASGEAPSSQTLGDPAVAALLELHPAALLSWSRLLSSKDAS
jgi:hypothetical protein